MSNSFATPWTMACQAPLSMGFPRQEYWSGFHFFLQGEVSMMPCLKVGFTYIHQIVIVYDKHL